MPKFLIIKEQVLVRHSLYPRHLTEPGEVNLGCFQKLKLFLYGGNGSQISVSKYDLSTKNLISTYVVSTSSSGASELVTHNGEIYLAWIEGTGKSGFVQRLDSDLQPISAKTNFAENVDSIATNLQVGSIAPHVRR